MEQKARLNNTDFVDVVQNLRVQTCYVKESLEKLTILYANVLAKTKILCLIFAVLMTKLVFQVENL